MAAVTVCSDFGAHENQLCHCIHSSNFYPEATGCWSEAQVMRESCDWHLKWRGQFCGVSPSPV